MFREQLPEALKAALKDKDVRAVSTLRLIMAALKDRDIAARSKGNMDGIPEDEILQMLQTMVKQRRESISMYEKGGRLELAEQEGEEIAIIQR
ncbi:MAG: GatB/YqeY domain-containing protein, partial [Alphaproteobacteria bacterium]